MEPSDPWRLVLEIAPGSVDVAPGELRLASPGLHAADRFQAVLLGGAIGDALGRPVERWERSAVRAAYPDGVRDFEKWRGWRQGPIGTITDDTQLSLAVAQWLAEAGDAALPRGRDFGRRVAAWGPIARGAGLGSLTAAANLRTGYRWWQSGAPTYGNGVAMRSAAVGLRYQGDARRLRAAVAMSGIATHRHPSAVAGGLVVAALTSHLVSVADPASFDPAEVVEAALSPLEGLRLPRHPLGGYPDREADLRESIGSVPDLLDRDVDEIFDHFYNGSAVFQSLPTAFWIFCRYGADDPERALVTAVSGGRDADTIAAIVGNWVGALHGQSAFPERWNGPELEFRDELVALGQELYDLWLADQEGER